MKNDDDWNIMDDYDREGTKHVIIIYFFFLVNH